MCFIIWPRKNNFHSLIILYNQTMFKKLFTSFAKETNFIAICIFIIMALGLIPLFNNQFKIAPKNTTYTYAHIYMFDFYQYLSWMKDGADGKLLITSRYSPETFSRNPVYLFYPALGFTTGKLGLPIFVGYTTARIFLAMAKLLMLYFFIAEIFKESKFRKTAFLIALFLPPLYHLFPLAMLFPQIASIDPINRTFFLPHDLLVTTLFLAGSVFFSRFLKEKKGTKNLIVSLICFIVASLANPSMMAIFYLFLGVALGFYLLQKPEKRVFLGSLALLVCFPIFLYYQHLFENTLPLSWMYSQQKTMVLNINYWGYLRSLGPVIFLVPFALIYAIKKHDFLTNLVLSWAAIPFILFPLLGRSIPVSQERLFEMSHFIPLSILGTIGFFEAVKTIKIKKEKKKKLLTTLTIFTFIGFSVPYFFASEKFYLNMFKGPYVNIYIPNSTLEAFSWLDTNTPDESVVAAPYFTANMLPAFTHNKVLFGHDFTTYQSSQRLAETEEIFKAETPKERVFNILKANKVSYLLVCPETSSLIKNHFMELGFELVYSNNESSVFKTGY